ncbi:MAG: M56 family metallopeptidase [Acidobacteria bacterium]|nr:M56 family metallopeptidase [Acidobacteriota bacterium]
MNALHETFARASEWLWPAVANHMWQATLFAAVVLCAALLLQRAAPARVRFALWLAAALKFALPAALFALLGGALDLRNILPTSEGAAPPLVLKIAEPVQLQSAAAELSVHVSGARGHSEIFCALTLAWAAGACVLFVVWLVRRREFVRSVRGGLEAWSGREFEALGRARARLGLKGEVLLVLSEEGTEPGVWRTRRPVLVLPRGVAAQLDEEELETVLLHELAHVERRDNLWGNFQTALECVFWFNPAVWLVGRRLLAERERACDERVLEAGGARGAYAAGILKVVRFCSGWRVAGVAGAASGSNLRRRIEMIMRGEGGARRVRAWHRAVVAGAGTAALLLTLGAGLFGGARARALLMEGVEGGPQQAPGGRVTSVELRGEERGPAVQEVERLPEVSVFFEHTAGAPVAITEATMRQVTREQLRRADEQFRANASDEEGDPFYITMPAFTLANVSGKAVREVGLGFKTAGGTNATASYVIALKPGESQTLRSNWRGRAVVLPGTLSDVKLRVVWVTFADGTQWGERARPPHPPSPPPPPDAPDAPDVAPRVFVGGGSGAGVGVGVGAGTGKGVALGGQELYAPEPEYPPVAKAAGAEGTVRVRITVDEEGNVVAAEAVSGHPLLRSAAVDAARAAKFKPTVVDGRPVKVKGVISYEFKLK